MSGTTMEYYGGIEGGGSHTTAVLLNCQGEIMAWAEGESTNSWLVGFDVAMQRIHDLIVQLRQKAGLPEDLELAGLGLTLSGVDGVKVQTKMSTEYKKQYSTDSHSVFTCSDPTGACANVTDQGGLVLIAGTGSCVMLCQGEKQIRSGGWGHMMGDEGSAYGITYTAIKAVFDHDDNLFLCPYDVTVVRDMMYKYFKVSDRMGMLDHLYSKFDKCFFAGMAKELARAANETKDPLCVHVFEEAGRLLAVHIRALMPQVGQELLNAEGGLKVVCVGSVWKSWNLLEPGFKKFLTPSAGDKPLVKEISLLKMTRSAAIGAASLGAIHVGKKVPVDYKANSEILYHQKF